MALESLKELLYTMKTLRGPDGCEWDRQQDPDSLKKYILEEAYEVIDAIDRGTPSEICDELGDLLLQVVFQAQIFQERGVFGMADVAAAIDTKLRRRHPHIFASAPENRRLTWEDIKQDEITEKGHSTKLSNLIPKALPALKRAEKLVSAISRTAEKPQPAEATCQKIIVAMKQITQPIVGREDTERRIGDILFNLTALARSLEIDAEDALRQSVDRRIKNYDKKGN